MGRTGLWTVLLRHAPAPEQREMELIVGAQRLRRNKNLWVEVTALRDIFSDIAGVQFPDVAERDGVEADTLSRAVQLLLDRIESTCPSGCPITLAAIQTFSVEIQYTLDCEQRYLESEIFALTAALDTETDSMSERPYTSASTRSVDSAVSDGLSRQPAVMPSRHAGLCESPARKTSKVRSRLPCKSTVYAVSSVDVGSVAETGRDVHPHQQGEHAGGPDSPVRRTGSSKFRNKLQAAKDENYFIDDYKLGVS